MSLVDAKQKLEHRTAKGSQARGRTKNLKNRNQNKSNLFLLSFCFLCFTEITRRCYSSLPPSRFSAHIVISRFWEVEFWLGMATETSKDELLQLVKRFSAYLTVKMSNLFSFNTPVSLSIPLFLVSIWFWFLRLCD